MKALIVGVGPGLSSSFARKLAGAGYQVALAAARTAKLAGPGPRDSAPACTNATRPTRHPSPRCSRRCRRRRSCCSTPATGCAARSSSSTRRRSQRPCKSRAFAGFLVAQHAARAMLEAGQGTILLTGASAGVKGYPQSAPFAMGKFALRGMAQSMARELHPAGDPRRSTSSWMAASAPPPGPSRPTSRTACSTPTRSRRPCWTSCASPAPAGPTRSPCGPGWSGSDVQLPGRREYPAPCRSRPRANLDASARGDRSMPSPHRDVLARSHEQARVRPGDPGAALDGARAADRAISDQADPAGHAAGVGEESLNAWHLAIGPSILALMLLRLAWRLTHPVPPAARDLPARAAGLLARHALGAVLVCSCCCRSSAGSPPPATAPRPTCSASSRSRRSPGE